MTQVGPGLVLPQQIDCWIDEFRSMNLPPFVCMYIQLLRVPLDVMYDCLSLQLRLKPPQEPSPHSVKQVLPLILYILSTLIMVVKSYHMCFPTAVPTLYMCCHVISHVLSCHITCIVMSYHMCCHVISHVLSCHITCVVMSYHMCFPTAGI